MEQFVCGRYDQLAQQLTAQGKPLYRLFRVAHPVISLPLDIRVEEEVPTYHILEQYMDRMVCGSGDEQHAYAFIESKEMLFSLLGVDGEGYDIALRFFEDLKQMGHFAELTGGALLPLPSAFRSLQTLEADGGKLARKFVTKSAGRRMLFDTYSLELMPGSFYDLQYRAMDPRTVEEKEAERYLWLENQADLQADLAKFDIALKNTRYLGQKAIDRGLPQGMTHLGVQPEGKPELWYYPYYLAVLRQGQGFSFEVYDYRRLTAIPWLTEMYRTPSYQSAVQRIITLCGQWEQVYLRNPLCEDLPLRLAGQVSACYGITCEASSGNYVWTVQDWQVAHLIRTCAGQERNTLQMLLENPVAVISAKEPGRTVRAVLTDEQKQRLQAALEEENPEDPEISALRERFREAVPLCGKEDQQWRKILQEIADKWPPAAALAPLAGATSPSAAGGGYSEGAVCAAVGE